MAKPRRAYELQIKIGADDRNALLANLHDIVTSIATERTISSVSGGYSSSSFFELDIDETITHDAYFERLQAYLDEMKAPQDESAE